jgi:hypothetical protein
MAGGPVVFLGPTLPAAEAAAMLQATYLPPAEQGSIVRAVRAYSPQAIVLIDGAFGKVPAVRHKEILWALARGIPVFGAASMGAIRAAELARFGMRGHGFIYRWYARTFLADDDEVAVAMSPPELGSAALSEALVNIRLTLRHAARVGVLPAEPRRMLEQLARQTHFVDRLYPRLLAEARSRLSGDQSPEATPWDRSRPSSTAGASGEWEAALERLAEWLPSGATGLLQNLGRRPELLLQKPEAPPFRLTEAWAFDLDAAGLLDQSI